MKKDSGKAKSKTDYLRVTIGILGLGLLLFGGFGIYMASHLEIISKAGVEEVGIVLEKNCDDSQLLVEIKGEKIPVGFHGKELECEEYTLNAPITLRHIPDDNFYVRPGESYQSRWLMGAMWAVIGLSLLLYLVFGAKKKVGSR
jgi:hypothetical protein